MFRTVWTLDKKRELEAYLKEGFPVNEIVKRMGIYRRSVVDEIKNGTEPQEFEQRRYIKYSADKAFERDVAKLKGEE